MMSTNSNQSETTDVLRAVGLFHLKSGLFVAAIALTIWGILLSDSSETMVENKHMFLVVAGAQVSIYYLLVSSKEIIRADNKLEAVLDVFRNRWPLIVILTGSMSLLLYSIPLALFVLPLSGGSIVHSVIVPAAPIGFFAGGVVWPYLTGCSLRAWILRPEGQYLYRLGRIFTVVTVSLTCIILSMFVLLLVLNVIGSILLPGQTFSQVVGILTGMACFYKVYKQYVPI